MSRNLSIVFLSSFGVSSVTIGIIQLVLGSVPFAWIIVTVSIDSTLGVVLATIAFIERDELTANNVVQLVHTSLRSLENVNERNSESERHSSRREKNAAFSSMHS